MSDTHDDESRSRLLDAVETVSSKSPRVRLALPAEQRALEALQRRSSLQNPGDRDALLAHPEAIELPLEQITRGQVFVVEAEGVIKGFAAILPRDGGDVELDGLFVEPTEWRRGYGKILVAHCAEVARAQGAKALYVIGNHHAAKFYDACGFEVLGAEATRFGSGLRMRKALT